MIGPVTPINPRFLTVNLINNDTLYSPSRVRGTTLWSDGADDPGHRSDADSILVLDVFNKRSFPG